MANLDKLSKKAEMAERIISNCSAGKGLLPKEYKGNEEDFFRLVQNNRRFNIEPYTVADAIPDYGLTYVYRSELFRAIRSFAEAGDPLAEKIEKYMNKRSDLTKGITRGFSGFQTINSKHRIVERLILRQMTEEEDNRYLNIDFD
ncbi:MAG: hypothetical protein AABX84_02080 [Nanoarchaeota archaeon]